MEIIDVTLSSPGKMYSDPILSHKDFIKYPHADHSLQEASRGIENVFGFLHGKAVVVTYKEE